MAERGEERRLEFLALLGHGAVSRGRRQGAGRDADDHEDAEGDPILRVRDRERAERRHEEVVEREVRQHGRRESRPQPRRHRDRQDHEQEDQRCGGRVGVLPPAPEDPGDDGQRRDGDRDVPDVSPAKRAMHRRPHVSSLFLQVERHARDDGVRLEEQRALDEQRALVVEQVVPPARRHELRQHDRDVVVRRCASDVARCTRAAAPSASGTASPARRAARRRPICAHSLPRAARSHAGSTFT